MSIADMHDGVSSFPRERESGVVRATTPGRRLRRDDGPHRRGAPLQKQRGVILFIALIVMVAMTLAAVALVRSVDTTTQVIANLAFRQASILPANYAVEDAVAALFADAGGPRITNVNANDDKHNYYATHSQASDDKYGVPQPLQTKTAALALKWQLPPDGAGNTVSYVIERMCNPDVTTPGRPADDKATEGWCDLGTPKGGGKHTINEAAAFDFPAQPFYRVTVRVDGPQNTVSFLQAFVR